jgi:hypothetical protein
MAFLATIDASPRPESMKFRYSGRKWDQGAADHPAALLALVAFAILAFAWPLENVPACVLAAVMVVVAAGITIRAHFHSASLG